MNARIVAMLLIVLLAGVAVAAERVYKWVDKDGVVHYGQQPPPDSQAEAIKVQKGYSTPADDEPAQPTEADKQAAQNAEYCRVAKDSYEKLGTDRPLEIVDQYGAAHVMTPEERTTERERAKTAMDNYCKPEQSAAKP